jgi:hypothetical protein
MSTEETLDKPDSVDDGGGTGDELEPAAEQEELPSEEGGAGKKTLGLERWDLGPDQRWTVTGIALTPAFVLRASF